MWCFEKWMCKIEKIGSYVKIDKKNLHKLMWMLWNSISLQFSQPTPKIPISSSCKTMQNKIIAIITMQI